VRALAAVPGVVVTGFVSDMRPYIAQATVVVVPLRFGSGMRQKILEAWAMEKCVSTRVGAKGWSEDRCIRWPAAESWPPGVRATGPGLRVGSARRRVATSRSNARRRAQGPRSALRCPR
jgi:hypothetical protein